MSRAYLRVALALLLGACSTRPSTDPLAATPGLSRLPPVAALVATGPVPDFSPMDAVVTHEDLGEIAPDLSPELDRLIGAHHVVDRRQVAAYDAEPGDVDAVDDTLVWKRDYQPIYVREVDGSITALHYLADNPNRVLAPSPLGSWPQEQMLPIVHGNLVTNGRYVFMTDLVLDANAEERSEPHLLQHGYRPRRRDDLLRLLARSLRRPVADIIILPGMPHEATQHVDLYLLPLSEREVLVPRIDDDALALITENPAKSIGRQVQVFLDEQSATLTGLGLEVLRLPMIPPAIGVEPEPEEGQEDLFELLVFSPANALLVNVGGQKHVMIPSFVDIADDHRLASLIGRYTREWETAFAARGWTPHRIDASRLVTHLGLFRCVTEVVPQRKLPRRRASLGPGVGRPVSPARR